MNDTIKLIITAVLAVLPSIWLAVLIHEGGHMIFGYIGGYRCYGLILPFVGIIKKNDRIIPVRSVSPFSGRCFLYPVEEKTMPRLAVAGGCMMNIYMGVLLFVLSCVVSEHPGASVFVFVSSLVNFALGLSNLIEGTPTSDGKTLRELRGSPPAHLCYDRIMMVEKILTDGGSIVDADDGRLEVPEGATGTLALELGIYAYMALAERYTGKFGYEYLNMKLQKLEASKDAYAFKAELMLERERLSRRMNGYVRQDA